MTAAFDTLKLADTLESAGFTHQQARGTAAALSEALSADLASKEDLRNGLNEMRLELKAEIANAKNDILKWIVSAIGFQAVAIVGAVVGLIKLLH